MKIVSKIIHSILLVTTPTVIACPAGEHSQLTVPTHHRAFQLPDLRTLSYDEVVELLALIESDSFEDTYSADELDQINQFISFLAMEGVTDDEKIDMTTATASLFRQSDFQYALAMDGEFGYQVTPAIYIQGNQDILLCKSWIKKQCKHTKSFVKKHKKAIIIGAIVVVAVTVVAVTAVAISSSAAATAASSGLASAGGAAGAAGSKKDRKSSSESSHTSPSESLASSLHEQVSSFKETIAKEQFAAAPVANGISIEENGRIVGSLFAHKTIDNITTSFNQNAFSANELRDFGANFRYPTPTWLQTSPDSFAIAPHPTTDRAFSTDYTATYASNTYDVNMLSYQARGSAALSSQCYTQAVQDFGKAISLDPSNPTLYLERGIANFELGNYENSMADYSQYVEKKAQPFEVTDFSLGFVKGLPKGAYESGKGTLVLLSDLVVHPVHTSKQVVDSFSQLATLVKNDEFGVIAEALSPEIHQLVTEWDTLPSETRGELAGYAVGKFGGDFATPGAIAKVAARSLSGARELAAICKNVRLAQETLVLETAAGIGVPEKVAEVVAMSKKTVVLGEELGVINKEIKISIPCLTVVQERNLLSSAAKAYDQNLSQVAHALSKHSGRHPETWGRLKGPMNTWHDQAVNQLKCICDAPGEFTKIVDPKTGITWVEKRLPDGRGVRLNQDYTFKGFID